MVEKGDTGIDDIITALIQDPLINGLLCPF